MKKLSLILFSIFTLCIGGFLSACSFKTVSASFTQEEVVRESGKPIVLDDFLTVEGAEKKEIEFKLSDKSLFEVQNGGRVLVAKEEPGSTYVHALYEKNVLASMKLVIMQRFDAPTNFAVSDDGVLSWDKVYGFYENSENKTDASKYIITGTLTTYMKDAPQFVEDEIDVYQECSSNSWKLDEDLVGTYDLKIKAVKNGYFNDSLEAECKFDFGFMREIQTTDFAWDSISGVLSWDVEEGERYRLKFNNAFVDGFIEPAQGQTKVSKDLTTLLLNAKDGKHSVSVMTYDNADAGQIAKESQKLEIVKLKSPKVTYEFSQAEGGKIKIGAVENATDFVIIDENSNEISSCQATASGAVSTLEGVAAGEYEIYVVAKNNATQTGVLHFRSSAAHFGKVLKLPKVTLAGAALNQAKEDESVFDVDVSTAENSKVNTNLAFFGLPTSENKDGIDKDAKSKTVQLEVTIADKFEISAIATPRTQANQIANGDNVFVVNSDVSDVVTFVKLAAFEDADAVSHSYRDVGGATKSVFTVDCSDENAKTLELYYFNGTEYILLQSVAAGAAEFVLDGKIEEVLTPTTEQEKQQFKFKVVARGENATSSLAVATPKEIDLLQAPTSASSGNSVDVTYSWNAVVGADEYAVELYSITKQQHDDNKTQVNLDVTSLTKQEFTTEGTSIEIEQEGYYYVRIYSKSTDVNSKISSLTFMEEVFYISEQLEIKAVDFGYSDEYKNYPNLTESTGYFVKIENVDFANSYELLLDDVQMEYEKIEEEDYSLYLLTEDFADLQEKQIKVKAKANDSTIYLDSESVSFVVEKLAAVEYEDLLFDDLTHSVGVAFADGVRKIKITQVGEEASKTTEKTTGANAMLDVKDLTTFSLKFELYGNADADGIYEMNDGKIWLNAEDAIIAFERVASPANLQYYDGNLIFEEKYAQTEFYIMDILATTPMTAYQISIWFKSSGTVAVYNGLQINIGATADYYAAGEIRLSKILQFIKANPLIASVYNQATSLQFAVFGYRKAFNSSGNVVELASNYAKTAGDQSKDLLAIEKLATTTLGFSYTNQNYNFEWTAVGQTAAQNAQTVYQIYGLTSSAAASATKIYSDATELKELTGGENWVFARGDYSAATYYSFFVKATNPYYLDSDNSNIVTIYQLSAISQMTLANTDAMTEEGLTQNGYLTYKVLDAEKDFVSAVQVTKDEGEEQDEKDGLIEIVGEGTYLAQVMGKTVSSDKITTYYIESSISSWTVENMSTLQPVDLTILYADEQYSWSAFAEGKNLNNLTYLLVFTDKNGKKVTYQTTQTTAAVSSGSDLFKVVSGLADGALTVDVYATLASYSVANGGTIYFAEKQTINGKDSWNVFAYEQNSALTKLPTPEVTSVDFVFDDLSKAQEPKLAIKFKGENDVAFSDDVLFNIFINEGSQPIVNGGASITPDEDGVYSFEIDFVDINNRVKAGEVLKIEIGAISSLQLPSTLGGVEIDRASQIESLKFVEHEHEGLSQKLEVSFASGQESFAVAGIILKVEYSINEGESGVEYIHAATADSSGRFVLDDVADFISQNMTTGGSVKVSAYVANYADDQNGKYILSCPTMKEMAEVVVLNGALTVANSVGGLRVDPSLNNEETKYLVECGALSEVVTTENGCYFEFPNDWANGDYSVSITAIQEGCVASVAKVVAFSLDRISVVDAVMFERISESDLSKTTLSWNVIDGASGYILKMYLATDAAKEDVALEFEAYPDASHIANGKISYSFEEIFGKNYENVFNFGVIDEDMLLADLDVVFELISVANEGKNNSYTYQFDATLTGNSITSANISVDEFGLINLTYPGGVGEKILYRFVYSDGSQVQPWKQVALDEEVTKLEIDKNADGDYVVGEGVTFEIEIIVMGNATLENQNSSASTDYDFALDSYVYTSLQGRPNLLINNAIKNVGYDANFISSLAFEMISTESWTKIYVGLSEEAILSGDVCEIIPTLSMSGNEGVSVVYAYDMALLIDDMLSAGLDLDSAAEDVTLYFWSFRQSINDETSYIISNPIAFEINCAQEDQFVEIMKMGTEGFVGNASYEEGYEDYANSFAVFNNADEDGIETLGVYVKIRQTVDYSEAEEPEGDVDAHAEGLYSGTKFVQTLTHSYFDVTKYVINMTTLFEEVDLINLTGKFEVQFAKLQKDSAGKLYISKWLEQAGEEKFEFERIEKVSALGLSIGNLIWNNQAEQATKFYVYFSQEIGGDNFVRHSTTTQYFNASDFAGVWSECFIAVQALAESEFVLPSKKVFVSKLNEETMDVEAVKVARNKINSSIELKDGTLALKWAEGKSDFYDTIMESGISLSDLAEKIVTTQFASPFLFTVDQLINDELVMRLSFTSLAGGTVGKKQSFDVKARYIIQSMQEFIGNDLETGRFLTRLVDLMGNSQSTETQQKYADLIKILGTDSNGVGNHRRVFDEIFESLQAGRYSLEYRLLGGSTTLNSPWQAYSNENGENVICVNAHPSVKAKKEAVEGDLAMNNYKVIFKKSQVYDYDAAAGEYKLVEAENYQLKLHNSEYYYAFAIKKGISSYGLSFIESGHLDELPVIGGNGPTISVEECDASGSVVAGGEYLMFFVNYNNGDSLLGGFGDMIDKNTFSMQLFAVGNNASVSSKSEYFKITFLSMGDVVEDANNAGWYNFHDGVKVVDGVFEWGVHKNRNTNVVYKKNTSNLEGKEVIDNSMHYARFSLDKLGQTLGDGLYDYVKFVREGAVEGYEIFIDSEIFQITNVQKLSAPTLTNDLGLLTIEGKNNASILENCFTGEKLGAYNYMIYNNVSTSSSYIKLLSEENSVASAKQYEVGTSATENMSEADLRYKQTEVSASLFSAMALGSTCEFKLQRDASNYHLYTMFCGNDTTKSIAVRSEAANIDAMMLDAVSELEIVDGIMTWTAVNGREYQDKEKQKAMQTPLLIEQTEESKVVYKITWAQYEFTNSSGGQVASNVGEEHVVYTTKNYFDFATIKESDLVLNYPNPTYLKATVQALALNISTVKGLEEYIVEFVEDGERYYGCGRLKFKDSQSYALMSNGVTIDKIDRVARVEDLTVVDGDLQWRYRTDKSVDMNNFKTTYSFVVEAEGKVVDGDFEVSLDESKTTDDENVFLVKFADKPMSLSAGAHTIKVYAAQISESDVPMIKSFAEEVSVDKLATVDEQAFAIESEVELETLDFSKYFEDDNNNSVVLEIKRLNDEGSGVLEVVMTKAKCKMFIAYSAEETSRANGLLVDAAYADYVGTVLTVGGSDVYQINAVAKNSVSGTMFSDKSRDFILKRSNIAEMVEIAWDAVAQKFVWSYNYNSLSMQSTATLLDAYLVEETTLYEDAELKKATQISLETETAIDVVEIGQNYVKILYAEERYYISSDKCEIEEKEGISLSAAGMYMIVQKRENSSIVKTEDGKLCLVSNDVLVAPVYIVEAEYSNGIKRIYESQENSFTPTIIGGVTMRLRIKLGDNNIQSEELAFDIDPATEKDFVEFNLFARGFGSSENPYVIENAAQFKNIAHRMSKHAYLSNYVGAVGEESTYSFTLTSDIDVGEFAGFLFAGEFSGKLTGVGEIAPTITYASTDIALLKNVVSVEKNEGYVTSPISGQDTMRYTAGTSLFESLSDIAMVKNVNLNVRFGSVGKVVDRHSLIAGLAVKNNGRVENVNITSFESNFTGFDRENIIVMVYSGLVSVNSGSGTILSCSALCDFAISDGGKDQWIFASGISFVNKGAIQGCVVGKLEAEGGAWESCQINISLSTYDCLAQVAGVTIINSGNIKSCDNYYKMVIRNTSQENNTQIYIADIATKNNKDCESVQNKVNFEGSGWYEVENIMQGRVGVGSIYVGDGEALK